MDKKKLIRNWHRKKILSIVATVLILANIGAIQLSGATEDSYIDNYINDRYIPIHYIHTDTTPTDTQSTDTQSTDTQSTDTQSTDTQSTDTQSTDTQSTDTQDTTPIVEDHFQGTSINKNIWTNIYDGPASGNTGSYFRPSNVIVNNGLHLRVMRESYNGFDYTSGGLSTSYSISQGRVEVRARFPPSDSGLVGYILLWPADGSWPPEIDFAETTGRDANLITFTQHYGSSDNHQTEIDEVNIDVTQYHTYIVDLINDELKWYIDGNLISTQKQNFDNTKWSFAAGVWAGACEDSFGGCPTNTVLPQYMDIDYVKIYDGMPN